MKPVVLSRHAGTRLRRLGVAEQEITSALSDPGYTTQAPAYAPLTYTCYLSRNLRTVRIGVREEPRRLLVTTVSLFGHRSELHEDQL
ncbi:MAG TPA: hypothetical protein VF157_10895 [Chloroflexota bacterium]